MYYFLSIIAARVYNKSVYSVKDFISPKPPLIFPQEEENGKMFSVLLISSFLYPSQIFFYFSPLARAEYTPLINTHKICAKPWQKVQF